MAATGQFSVEPRDTNPLGGLSTVSPWLIQTPILSPLPGRPHGPARQVAQGLHPGADREDRDPRLEELPGRERRAVLVDAGRPPGEDDPLVAAGENLVQRVEAGEDLGVDAELADAAPDQLGVTGAEAGDRDLIL